MDPESSGNTLDIEQYVHVLTRQWRLIVMVALVGLLVAVGYHALAPSRYTATTTVNLTVISTEPFAARNAPSSLLDDEEERAIAQSHAVAVRASEIMDGDRTASEIREASNVSTSSGAAVVSVAYTADTPQRATAGADAVASAYLAYRSERADERISVLVDSLDTRIGGIQGRIEEIDDALSTVDVGSAEASRPTTERQQLLGELDGLLSERNGLQSVDTTAGFVLSAAADNAVESAPSSKLTLLTGLAVGIVLGVLAAFLRNPRDRRLRTGEEVARALGAPVLSQLGGGLDRVPARGDDADALRVARERILANIEPGDVVAVIDASHENTVSSSALNLAVVTAQAGQRVQLVVPEDPRRVRGRLQDVLEASRDAAGLGGAGGILSVVDTTDTGDDAQRDLLIAQQATLAIEDADERTLTFLVLTANANPASLLAALRMSRAVVLVSREMVTTTTEVGWLRREAAGLGVETLGTIVESPPRRVRGGERRRPSRSSRRRDASRRGDGAHRRETLPDDDASLPVAS